MEVENVEIICALAHYVDHQRGRRNDIGGEVIQSKSRDYNRQRVWQR